MDARAFGKLDLSSPPQLRPFEVYFNIIAREGAEAWKSSYVSVQNLLSHLGRYTMSYSSREKYLTLLHRFCRRTNLSPDQLARLPREKAEALIQNFADELAASGRSKSYVNTVIKRLRSFYRVNGYRGNRELVIASQFVPARYRKRSEYIPTKDEVHAIADSAGSTRNRAIVLTLWGSGLRVSTLLALYYSDVAEEVGRQQFVRIPVYPEMKQRVHDACKGSVPYYSFIFPDAVTALRAYTREREEKYGPLRNDSPLFHSEWNLHDRSSRSMKRLGRKEVGALVKKAAKLAGIRGWMNVTPHSLRKSFESVLHSPTLDGGRLDKGTQEFLFGHILPGSQDAYYDRSRIEFHRDEYAKLDFSKQSTMRWVDAVLAAVKASARPGEDPENVIDEYTWQRYGKDASWRSLPEAQQVALISEAMQSRRTQEPIRDIEIRDEVVSSRRLKRFLDKGYLFVARINDEECVVRQMGNSTRT